MRRSVYPRCWRFTRRHSLAATARTSVFAAPSHARRNQTPLAGTNAASDPLDIRRQEPHPKRWVQDLARQLLRHRQLADVAIAPGFVRRLQVNRWCEVRAGFDAVAGQLGAYGVARRAEFLRDDAQAQVLLRRGVPGQDLLEVHAAHATQRHAVRLHQALAFLHVGAEHPERFHADERVDLAHARVQPDELTVVVARVGVVAPDPYTMRGLRITQADDSALAGRDGLGRRQAEDFGVAERAGGTTLIGRAERMRRVQNEAQPVLSRQGLERVERWRIAAHIDGENRRRARRDLFLQVFDVDVVR